MLGREKGETSNTVWLMGKVGGLYLGWVEELIRRARHTRDGQAGTGGYDIRRTCMEFTRVM